MRFSVCEPGGNAAAGDIGKGRLSGCERIGAGRCRRSEESPRPRPCGNSGGLREAAAWAHGKGPVQIENETVPCAKVESHNEKRPQKERFSILLRSIYCPLFRGAIFAAIALLSSRRGAEKNSYTGISAMRAHSAAPQRVGTRNAAAVHFRLFVSRKMVASVVAHGQCSREKTTMQTAVFHVHPFASRRDCSCGRESSERLPCTMYVMMRIGTTISFAGRPRIKASKMAPSRPRIRPIGSSACAQCESRLAPPTSTLARIHSSRPAGAANISY